MSSIHDLLILIISLTFKTSTIFDITVECAITFYKKICPAVYYTGQISLKAGFRHYSVTEIGTISNLVTSTKPISVIFKLGMTASDIKLSVIMGSTFDEIPNFS